MKPIKLSLTLLSIFMLGITFYSCGNKSNDSGPGKEYDNIKEEDASSIIEYTNSLIDELRSSGSWMESNYNNISKLTNAAKSEQKKQPIGLFITPYIGSFTVGKKPEVSKALNKEDADFLTTNMATYRKNFSGLRENIDALEKYYEAEDYKDDKFVKGKALADSISSAQELLSQIRTTLYDKIDVIANVAEEIVLKNDPLRDPILAAKSDLKDFGNLYDNFYYYSQKTISIDSLERSYNRLASAVENHKGAFEKILKEQNKDSDYKNYYKTFDDEALLKSRKILRNAKEGKSVTEYDLDDISSAQNSLIRRYNSFVK